MSNWASDPFLESYYSSSSGLPKFLCVLPWNGRVLSHRARGLIRGDCERQPAEGHEDNEERIYWEIVWRTKETDMAPAEP